MNKREHKEGRTRKQTNTHTSIAFWTQCTSDDDDDEKFRQHPIFQVNVSRPFAYSHSYCIALCVNPFRLLPQSCACPCGQYLPPTPSVIALPSVSIPFAYSLSLVLALAVNTFRLLPQFVSCPLYQYLSPTPSANALPAGAVVVVVVVVVVVSINKGITQLTTESTESIQN